MANTYIDFNTITDFHRFYHIEKPRHPLVSIVNLAELDRGPLDSEVFYRLHFYAVLCKQFTGRLMYGKQYYDFDEGSLVFTAPHQAIARSPETHTKEGWGLFFHADLLHGTELGKKIEQYSFFHYDANEALHISDTEKQVLKDCLEKIRGEYSQNFDKHTPGLIVGNVQLFLDYCDRFYDRQFITRAKVSSDVVQRFEQALNAYFADDALTDAGLPTVKYFAAKLGFSPDYLSDLLSKYTGKTTQEHIHLKLVDRAKALLWSTEKTVSEIAYLLGFEHPSHFSKLFKSKTGVAPKEFRNSH